MSKICRTVGLGLALTFWIAGCSPAPDVYPAGTSITFRMMDGPNEQLVLGPKSSQLFLDMLAQVPVRSSIGKMPALPMGFFFVDGNTYVWHGNAVIRGSGNDERLWHGPFLQRLIEEVRNHHYPESREEIQKILDTLENDPHVASTPVEGPGAYPGGGDALHPLSGPPTEENGWQKFEPKAE